MVAIRLVPRFRYTPNQPSMPKNTAMASTLGRIASRPTRAESSMNAMTAKITTSASDTLLI